MLEYIFILPSHWDFDFSNFTKINRIFIPKNLINFPHSQLKQSVLWIVKNDSASRPRLMAVLSVSDIIDPVDSDHQELLLVSINVLKSFALCDFVKDGIFLNEQFSIDIPFRLLSENESLFLTSLVAGSLKYRFVQPESIEISFEFPIFSSKNLLLLTHFVMERVLRTYSLTRTYCRDSSYGCGPFGEIVFASIMKHIDGVNEEDLRHSCRSVDPFLFLIHSRDAISNADLTEPPLVNIMTGVLPASNESITTRFFSSFSQSNIVESQTKLQQSEEDHQNLVRRLFRFLSAYDCMCFFSNSIDLFFVDSSRIYIIEVKSANIYNFENQLERAIFHLLWCEYSLKDGYDTILKYVVISDIQHGRKKYWEEFAFSLGMKIIFAAEADLDSVIFRDLLPG